MRNSEITILSTLVIQTENVTRFPLLLLLLHKSDVQYENGLLFVTSDFFVRYV